MKWIQTSKREPLKNVRVLVCYSDGSIGIDHRQKLSHVAGLCWSTITPKYWQPLPEMPAEFQEVLTDG